MKMVSRIALGLVLVISSLFLTGCDDDDDEGFWESIGNRLEDWGDEVESWF